MNKEDIKEQYINFDEYIRQGEPAQRERAEAWRVAIGLQAVDGLKTSEYLQETARRNIEGEITIDEACELINTYYQSKSTHNNLPPRTSSRTSTPQVPHKLPDKLPDKFDTDNDYIKRLIKVVGNKKMSIREILDEIGLKNRESFMDVYLNPAISEGFIRLLYPDKPRHPRQKYLLTAKGVMLYKEIMTQP